MSHPAEIEPAKILDIKIYPDPFLKQVCEHVDEVTNEIKILIQNMFITMYNRNGVGLAADQVGVAKRIFVMDTSMSGQKRHTFINPEIIESSEIQRWREGCLSFPEVFSYVKRPNKIKVRSLDIDGKLVELELQGIEAVCFQHELDHLNGINFYDHLSQLQKNMIRKKMRNLKK